MQKFLIFCFLLNFAVAGHCQAHSAGPAFEVAIIKAVESEPQSGGFIVMQGPHRFVEKNCTLQLLIAAAYNLDPKAVIGGPPWMHSIRYDITALTPGDKQPDCTEPPSSD